MKKAYMIVTMVMAISLNAFTQLPANNRKAGPENTRGIILEEDFDGLTALPPGWTVYVQDSWDMILPQNDEVIFFKQSTGLKTMILSTPLIDLSNASQLTFRFRSSKVISTLKIGLMTDPSNPNSFQLLTQFQADTNMILYTVPLGAVTGSKHLAFNWVGTYFKSAYLDDVIVYDDALQNNIPANVSAATMIPGPAGINGGTLSWTNPSLEADGDPLTDLDSIRIMISGSYYTTVFNPTIGASQNIPFTIPFPALYTATFIPYNTAGEGIPNTTPEVWVGLDIPDMPENVILTQVGNLATLKWSPPKVGVHGGYFDGIITFYQIRRADNWETVIPGTDSTLIMDVTDPGTFNYKVTPLNTSGAGPAGTSNTGVFLFGTYLLWEDFWVSVPAHLWSVQGENFYNWWRSSSNLAGGTEPEMLFQSNEPYFNSYSRVASPPLNTSGFSAVTLEFRHGHTVYTPYQLKVETSSDNGVTWHTGAAIPITQTITGEEKTVVLTNTDVGAANFKFAFTYEGSEANMESFSIDNVRLSPTLGIDVAANSIVLPDIIHPADVVVPKAIVQNLGVNAVPYKAYCVFSSVGGVVYSDSVTTTILPGASDTVMFSSMVMPEGEMTARVTLRCLSDGNPLNDTITRYLVSYKTYTRDLVILEDATGTWCTYCPGASMGIEDLISNGMPVAAIAYHGGDSYETPESRARINYYPAITGFPTVMFDGLLSYVGGTHSTSLYAKYLPLVQQRLEIPTPVKVSVGTIHLENNILTAQVNLESLSPIRNNNIVLHAVLTQSEIPEAWQDQTELNDVERMMYADSTGTPVDLADKTESMNLQMTVNPAWVKENLQLIVFAQDKVTREIFNGDAKKPEIGSVGENLTLMRAYPNPASGSVFFPGLRNAKIQVLNMSGVTVFFAQNISGLFRLDVSQLESGLYMVKIYDVEHQYYSKIQVIH